MKEIRRAENAGFCFGVKQAIEKAEKAAEQLYMYPKAAMIQPPAMRAHPLKQLVRHLRRQLTVVPSICFQT